MRFVPTPKSSRCFSVSIPLVLAITAVLSPEPLLASREAEGSGAAVNGYRVVTTGPGYEIRADVRNYYTRVFAPVVTPGSSLGAALPEEFATVGNTAVATPSWRPLPLYGGTLTSAAVSPKDANFVLAGVLDGDGSGSLFQSQDGGVTWSLVELQWFPPYYKSLVSDIEFASDGAAYAATEIALMRRAADTGEWTVLRSMRSYEYEWYYEVSVNPSDGREIWIGAWRQAVTSGGAIFRSNDGGATWDDVTPPAGPFNVTGIAFNQNDPRNVVASFAYNPPSQVWRTLDSGATWTRGTGVPNSARLTDVVHDGSRFLMGSDIGNAGVVASSDDGLTWSRASGSWPSVIIHDLDADPRRPGVVLASTDRGLVRQKDGAWTTRVGGLTKRTSVACLFPGDPNHLIVGQESEGVMRSVDGGASFNVSSSGLLALNVSSVAFSPIDPLEMTAAFKAVNSGGVYTSRDGGQTWQLEGLPAARYDALEYAPDGTLYVASIGPTSGSVPEGVYRRNAAGNWTAVGPFTGPSYEIDVRCILADPLNSDTIIATGLFYPTNTGGIWRSTNRGQDWERVYTATPPTPGTNSSVVGDVRFVNDGTGQTLLAAHSGIGGVLRSVDGGRSWSSLMVAPNGLNSIGLYLRGTPADPGTFYAASYYSGAGYRTRDGGTTWSLFPAPSPSGFEVDRSNPDIVYAFSISPSFGLMRSRDGGVTYSRFDEGIPLQWGNEFAWQEGPCPTLYHATTGGVYAREIDSVAPQVSLTLDPNVLWPPNHKLRTIHATITTMDTCDPAPTFLLSSIVIEGDDGSPDDIDAAIGEATTTFRLRAERSGQCQDGRRYIVTYAVTDASGNQSQATATVLVPHDQSGAVATYDDESGSATRPAKTELVSIEPNPFNPSTSVILTVAHAQRVTLAVYDVRGALVRNIVSGEMPAGKHRIAWDGTDHAGRGVASGIYFFRFVAGTHVQTMKALMIK